MKKDKKPAAEGNSVLVWSSDAGRVCPGCGNAAASCRCRELKKERPAGDGIVRVGRETKGRGGKTVTVITGVPLDDPGLKELATALKKKSGTGGTLKDGVIEIQGDHRDLIVAELEKKGYRVKKAGG